ncbi:MAG: DUF6288 domain-containing protein [Planctomycetota bacterium]|jgi:hypothetical protein|nr:DUF6288 domain-containing protein [Planctomycetota bacterium]MDA1201836.1 DUF6288 domain-containing protein [Planctomycetota bacterium]
MPAFPILRARLGLASGLAILVAFLATSMDPCPAGQGSYPLGDLGGRAALADNQLQITALLPSQPGDAAGLKIGDVITGVAGMPFATGYLMPLRQLGTALDDAQGRDGGLRLGILRAGRQQEIMVRLPRTGRFSHTYPFACPKSERIYQQACGILASELQDGSLQGGDLTTAIALMGLMGDRTGRGLEVARPVVMRLARDYAAGPSQRSVWVLSYVGVMLCEYQMAAPDPTVAAAIRRIAEVLVAGVPNHGRYGHHVTADPEDLPYGGQGLNATTTAVLWFFASAARAGLDPSALEPAFSRSFDRIRKETNAGGGVGYAWAGDHQSPMRSGQMALACNHIVQTPAWLTNDPQGLRKYHASVATWPTRHADHLLEAHAVSSMGLTASTAGLAAADRGAYQALMQQWRWYFALSWQPSATGSDHELAYVGGPNNTGGDYYLNGHRDLTNDGFNSIMTATVAFILAASQERLSFYGGLPGVPGLSSAVLVQSPALRQATIALRQGQYGQAWRLAARVAGVPPKQPPAADESGSAAEGQTASLEAVGPPDEPAAGPTSEPMAPTAPASPLSLDEALAGFDDSILEGEPAGPMIDELSPPSAALGLDESLKPPSEPEETPDTPIAPADAIAAVGRAFLAHVETQYLTPALDRLRRQREVGDVVAAMEGLERFVANVRGLPAYEKPARSLLDELQDEAMQDAIAAGREFRRLELRLQRGSKDAVEDLASFAADHEGEYYGKTAARLVEATRLGIPLADLPSADPLADETPEIAALPIEDNVDFTVPDRLMTIDEILGATAESTAAPAESP